MPNIDIDPRLINVAIEELPAIIAWLRSAFQNRHPDAPVPTSEEIIAAYESAYQTSLATDDAILAAHPEQP